MRIVQINISEVGSTGKIMHGLSKVARENGHEVWSFSPIGYQRGQKQKPAVIKGHSQISSRFSTMLHLRFYQLSGIHGVLSVLGGIQLLMALKRIRPDLIQLHNLHSEMFNLPLLFGFIKKYKIPTIWTLHDCWSFTGKCPHFEMAGCEKWKSGCGNCPQINEYPRTLIDNTKFMWKLKRRWFTGVDNMTIVTPSQWLADLVKQSFLRDYPVKVINNGIDLDVFKPIESNVREKYGIAQDKFMILGVAADWGVRKGLDVFVELSKRLDDRFQIVLVGTDDRIDKQLPENIVSIHRTENQKQLAEIYTTADLFVNPTREEVLGLVNIEANACGTPVITFNSGGSPECINDYSGSIVDKNDIDAMAKEIIFVFDKNPYSMAACMSRANIFDMNKKYLEYLAIYERAYKVYENRNNNTLL